MSDPLELDDAARAQGIALLEAAFVEDLGANQLDLTAAAVAGTRMRATLVARQAGVACGLPLAAEAFRMRGVSTVEQAVEDATRVEAGMALLRVEGDAAAAVAAERTALNVLQRLSGVATLTRRFADEVAATSAGIYDTRKTQPALRRLQRYAVRCGGGFNHRFGLYDEAMLKDNHIAACGGITAAVARIREAHPGVRIHVEADTFEQAGEAVLAGADVVLLDNMSNEELARVVGANQGQALLEASGGVTLETVGDIARTGVDRISVGALTHSAPAFDAALDAR